MRIIECDRCGSSMNNLPYYSVKARRIDRRGETDRNFEHAPFEICLDCMSLMSVELEKHKREYDRKHLIKRV